MPATQAISATQPHDVLPSSIAARLRIDVVSQHLRPGATITEADVALRFSVARPTARRAIDALVADGLLHREANHAARIPVLTANDISDLFDARAIIETAAMASLAVSGAIPADALTAHRALRAAKPAGPFASHDIAFHRALVRGQPSPRLTRMHTVLMGEIELGIGQVQAAHLLTSGEVARQHQGILDAIIAGDQDASARLTREHIHGARDRLLAHMNSDQTPPSMETRSW